ncbi:MAG: bifunctional oligoribonuclease/PAP phosphatase NrnA [Clostridia bacterium]|nr:bifunctional oligoribonuclease/PAP phosphatase NrnA [Clostridia bacterium]
MSEFLTDLDELIALLESPTDTLILFHRNPDADAVGSAFALSNVLEQLGSPTRCVCQDEVPANLQFLMNGTQESVLADAVLADFEPVRIISVDTASRAQMGTLADLFGESVDVMIDHHEQDDPYGAQCYIRPSAAATGEILFDLIKRLAEEERITIDEAMCIDLYAAISGDTGCFRYSNVTPKTHIRAAELVASGIDCADINRRLFENKSLERLRAQSAAISNMELFADGKIAVVTFPYALKAALGLSDADLDALVDIPRSLSGVEVALCIRQPLPEGKFRVSCRSNGAYDVAALCRKFDGGGHARAAGCTLTALDIGDAMHRIVSAIHFE